MRPAVIIGDGASATLAAAALARRDAGPVLLIGPDNKPGAGLAYRTTAPYHLLNSRASCMSVRSDRPDDFVSWCRRTGRPLAAGAFAARRRYGGYLTDHLAGLVAAGAVRRRAGRVVAIEPAGRIARLADGSGVPARSVILATGHDAPVTPPVPGLAALDAARYVADPGQSTGLDRAARARTVLLLGTGLTAVDTALALHRRRPDTCIVAVSRHGLLPAAHLPDPPVAWTGAVAGDTRELLRQVREQIAAGADWRAVVDGMRASAETIWSALSPTERRRFLDHVDRYWQIHRHRMAPTVAHAIESMVDSGGLRVLAGRPQRVTNEGNGAGVRVRTADGIRTLHCDVIVNCTGPGRWAAGRDPLAVSLRSTGLVRLDSLGYGLACDRLGRPLDATGMPVAWLWALGPVRLGSSWETTAVPEIRAQVDVLASALAGGARSLD